MVEWVFKNLALWFWFFWSDKAQNKTQNLLKGNKPWGIRASNLIKLLSSHLQDLPLPAAKAAQGWPLWGCCIFSSILCLSSYSLVSSPSISSCTRTLCQVGWESPGIHLSCKASAQRQILPSHPRHLPALSSRSSEPLPSRVPAACLEITPRWKGDWEEQRIQLRSRIPVCGAAAPLTSLRSQEFASSCFTQNNSRGSQNVPCAYWTGKPIQRLKEGMRKWDIRGGANSFIAS